MNNQINRDPKFKLGEVVIVKSYYGKIEKGEILVEGDPLHLPPLMIITGIEVEDKKKVTHDKELGKQIAEFVKYHVTWFDNRESTFVNKVLYESMLDNEQGDSVIKEKTESFEYGFGKPCNFKTTELEIKKRKSSSSFISDSYSKYQGKEKKDNAGLNERDQNKLEALVSFACPPLLCIGILKNSNKSTFNIKGEINSVWPEILVKVMWFNYQQQKYSEAELPIECLINVI